MILVSTNHRYFSTGCGPYDFHQKTEYFDATAQISSHYIDSEAAKIIQSRNWKEVNI